MLAYQQQPLSTIHSWDKKSVFFINPYSKKKFKSFIFNLKQNDYKVLGHDVSKQTSPAFDNTFMKLEKNVFFRIPSSN